MGVVKLFDDYKIEELQFIDSNKNNQVSLEVFKEMASYFDFSVEDAKKFISYSKGEELKRTFIKQHNVIFDSLTCREKQVFIYVVNGKKTAEISEILFVEPCTISSHRKKIKQKLHLNSIFDWYKYAKAFDLLNF